MLGVVDDLASLFPEKGDGVGDHAEIFGGRGAQNLFDMQERAFAEDSDHGGFGLEKKTDLGIGGGVDIGATGRAKGGELAASPVKFLRLRKKFSVFVVRARPTSFDIVESVRGEALGEAQFIG